jgi:4-amino-4-deoxy-L-arabinose transferase-like glycosyltransferase
MSIGNTLRSRRSAFTFTRFPEWLPLLILFLALLAAALLRFWRLDNLGFNSDEAVYSGQAASIAGNEKLSPYFPVFRAHPLLFQTFLSIGYTLGMDPMVGRFVSALVGIATVLVTYKIGALMFSRSVGALAAVLIAVMPYHVIVTRQVLLDGPMALFATLSLYCLARYCKTETSAWLYATGATMGLVFLAKEPGILYVGAIFVFFALTPSVPVTVGKLFKTMAIMVIVMLPYPTSLFFAERSGTTSQFITWQLFRRPNHDWYFYFTELPHYVGPLLLVVILIGLIANRRGFTWRESLLLTWLTIPTVFFVLWQVKGFQYLLPASAPLAVLGARFLTWLPTQTRYQLIRLIRQGSGASRSPWSLLEVVTRPLTPLLSLVVIASLFVVSFRLVDNTNAAQFLAGTGGVPGGREAGEWIDKNVPQGAEMLTIGPSMANILQFYGDRKAYGLSVSSNPLHRNPVYEPVANPDFLLRTSQLQYIVWDSYSASRSDFFSSKLLDYADRYHGRIVYTGSVTTRTAEGEETLTPVIIIYEVRP